MTSTPRLARDLADRRVRRVTASIAAAALVGTGGLGIAVAGLQSAQAAGATGDGTSGDSPAAPGPASRQTLPSTSGGRVVGGSGAPSASSGGS
jgi:hypothetical protein